MNYRDIIESALPGVRVRFQTSDGIEAGSVSGYPIDRDETTLIPVCTDDYFILLIDTKQILTITQP